MFKIEDYSDAELEFKRWLEDKFPRAKNVNFKKVWKDKELWILEGDVTISTGLFKYESKKFKVQMTLSGEIVNYEIFEEA